MDDKGCRDSREEVCHHVVRDYNFLTQKKKFFLKMISSPPFAPCCESNNAHMDGYVQYTYDNFYIKKNFSFWS